jgi:hypothetical protein
VIVLGGVILLVLGFLLHISILWTIGLIVLIIGAVFFVLGQLGHAVGGRKYWYWAHRHSYQTMLIQKGLLIFDHVVGRTTALVFGWSNAALQSSFAPTVQPNWNLADRRSGWEEMIMPGKKKPGPSVKDPEVYEEIREQGGSKEKAARIANAAAAQGRSSVGTRGGKSGSYDDWKVEDLRKRAKELGMSGYSGKKKSELVSMLRNH